MKFFSLKDLKSNSFGTCMQFQHSAEAIRAVAASCKNEKTVVSQYPADFELWQVAEFNEHNGEMVPALDHVSSVHSIAEATKAVNNG